MSKGRAVKPALVIAAAIVTAGIGLWLAREPVLVSVGSYLVVQDELVPADVIHVIAGTDDRTDYAIELYHQGYGERIFFTGGWCDTIQADHGQYGRQRAIDQGVPPEAIVADSAPVTSTYSEVVRLREWIAARQVPVRSVVVVSDPYHMRRARWAYRRVLGKGINVQMAPVPNGLSPYRQRWWGDAESRKYVRQEYAKIAYYYVRYQFSWGPVKKWLASLDVS